MKTTHEVTICHEFSDGSELELLAKVSPINGTRGFDPSDLEIEWLGTSQDAVWLMSRADERQLEQRAREGWHDAMADEPSELEEQIDHAYAQWKEERYAAE